MPIVKLLFRGFSVRVAVAIFFGVAAGACSAALIAAIAAGLRSTTVYVVTAFAVLAIARVSVEFVANVQLQFVANETIGEMRMRLARSILAAPLHTLEGVGTPRLLGALTEDTQTIGDGAQAIIGIATAGGLILGAVAYVLWLAPTLGLLVVVAVVLASLAYSRPRARGQRKMEGTFPMRHRMFVAVSGSVRGMHELKLHRRRRETYLRSAVEDSIRTFHRGLTESFQLFAWGELLNSMVFFAIIGAIVFALPHFAPAATRQMPSAVLALLYLPAPFELVFRALPEVARANATIADLEELGLSLESSAEADAGETPARDAWKSIELRGVVHRLTGEDDRHFALGPIDLRLEPGEIVYVTGGNGSGKTTLAKLLVGFYPPEDGQIVVDGRAVDAGGFAAYRERFGAIFSDSHVFDRPYGVRSDSLEADARKLLARLALDDRVSFERGTFSTTDLSQGQRARLAMVTALLDERPVYVFDEWAAHQDPEFKTVFYERLLPELKSRGKTVVAITHDDRYFHLADRIVRLEEGKVVS